MDFEKLEKKINKIEKSLNNISSSSINKLSNKYFKNKCDIDILIPNYEFDALCEYHLYLYKTIKRIQNLEEYVINENENALEKVLKLKIKIDRLIIAHPSYNKLKFNKLFNETISIYKNEYFLYKGNRGKQKFLEELSEYLINNNYIDKNQVKNFKRLFRKMKIFSLDEKILWLKDIVELRGFTDAFKELDFLKLPSKSDVFISLNFTHKDRKVITNDYFANLTKRDRCQDFINNWIDILNKIEMTE